VTVRVYIPLTSAGLAGLVAEGRIPGPVHAHAPEGDDEELEYEALMAAADESWSLRGDEDRARRYVVAADVREVVRPGEGDEPTSVRLEHDVTWKNIASAHVDTEDYPGDERDLAWFATQEIRDL
jgi:hypothetical protein